MSPAAPRRLPLPVRPLWFFSVAAALFCTVVPSAAVPSRTAAPPPRWTAVSITPGQVGRAIARLDGLARRFISQTGVPGLAVAVVYDDKLAYARGFGVRVAGRPEKVDPETVFQLASLSKPVGATVVAAAVGRGWTAWNKPIVASLPWFRLSDPYVTRAVTVGDLYSHRSGLGDHAGDSLEDLGFDRATILQRLRHLPLAPFRSTYAYTNFGVTAAAESVAVARGTTWSELSAELVFRPLGMTSTSSDFSDYASRSNRAIGHVRDGERWEARQIRQPDAQSPAGGVSSNVIDMARWMRMVLALGSFDGRVVVDRGALMELLTPQMRAGSPAEPASRTSFYGYGIGIADDGTGRVRLSHSGAFALGAATSFTLLPAEHLGIVVLSNGMPIGLPEALIAAFLDLVETGTVQRDWLRDFWTYAFQALYRNPSVLAGLPPPQLPRPARRMAAYGGRYWNAYYGEVLVAPTGDGLTMTVGPTPTRYDLSPWSGDQFRYFPSGENALGAASVRFGVGRDGKIESVEVENFEPGVNVLRRQPELALGRRKGVAADE